MVGVNRQTTPNATSAKTSFRNKNIYLLYMKRLLISSLLSALMLYSCSQLMKFKLKGGIDSSWKFSHMNNELKDTTSANGALINTIYRRFNNGYLHLYDDHSYTFVGDNISALHTWSLNSKDSTLSLDSFLYSKPLGFKLLEKDNEWLKLDLSSLGKTSISGGSNTMLFVYDPYFETKDIDLLDYQHNQWRIKPSHHEDRAQLKKRLTAHIDYLIAYFQMIEDDNRSSFIPMYLQSMFKFYSNGIAVRNEENIDESWDSYFYDHEDAIAAQKILVEAIEGMGPYPESQGSFTKGYIKALQKMKVFLEKVD